MEARIIPSVLSPCPAIQAKPEPCLGHHGDKNETTFKINIYFY